MKEFHIRAPISKGELGEISIGSTVYLSGLLYEMRGPAQVRALEYWRNGKALPFSLENAVIAQTYSNAFMTPAGWKINCLGISTSKHAQKYAVDMIKHFKLSALVGKGGMAREVLEAMKEFKCIYLAQVGGCGALYTNQVKNIKGICWEDLGLEKVLAFEVEDYGPLLVAMDNKGNSLYEIVQEEVKRRIPHIYSS